MNNDYTSGSGSNSSTPRGSLSNINSIRGRSASINSSNLRQQSPALKTAILNNSRFSNGNDNYAIGVMGANAPANTRRPPHSPLVSRRETSINDVVVDVNKMDKHKEVSTKLFKRIYCFKTLECKNSPLTLIYLFIGI